MKRLTSALAICSLGALAQAPAETIYTGADKITFPKVVKKREPTYTDDARNARISGQVWLDTIIDETGTPRDITVVSPVGYGLDEKAVEAVSQWKLKPGLKDGVPVKVRATVAVSFHLQGVPQDPDEKRRGLFNRAVTVLNGPAAERKPGAIEALHQLADEKFAPAMFAYGLLLSKGDGVAKDEATALSLFQGAANKRYGPALYEIGLATLRGKGLPLDAEKGKNLITQAANLGSDAAQHFIGAASEAGIEGWDQNESVARQFFRLCGASGRAECQFRLARLLLARPGRNESDFTQAIALLELAEARVPGARPLLAPYANTLTDKERRAVEDWKPKLTRKP